MGRFTLHTCELLYSPDWDLPMVDAAVLVDQDGVIHGFGDRSGVQGDDAETYHHQILMPGVVNAHIHVTDGFRPHPVPGGNGLVDWVGKLMPDRNAGLSEQERDAGIRTMLADIRQRGTVAIGEVVNNDRTLDAIWESGLYCRFIFELIGFREDRVEAALEIADSLETRIREEEDDAGRVRYANGVHAPYSVSPKLMMAAAGRGRFVGRYFYQHLAEDPDERELYENGTGRWREFSEKIGAWESSWNPPGMSPIRLYDTLGLLANDFVAVHLTDATDEEIDLLARRGVKAIFSPTSNLHITGRLPDVERIVGAGMTVALGTDGRGSNPDMDVFSEARLLKERYPEIPSGTWLRALTSGGADILQFSELGRIREKTAPGLVAVEVRHLGGTSLEECERSVLLNAVSRVRVV